MFRVNFERTERICKTRAVDNSDIWYEWHRRLGHSNFDNVNRIRSEIGLNSRPMKLQCEACVIAKLTRCHFSAADVNYPSPLDLIHTDTSGTIRVHNPYNYTSYITFTDHATRYSFVYLLTSKADVHKIFDNFMKKVQNIFNTKIKRIRSDNGTEYTCSKFQEIITQHGIHHQFTIPATPEQDGISERLNRTIGEGVRTLLLDSGVRTSHWPNSALRNRLRGSI